MPDNQLKPHTNYIDGQIIQLVGPDNSQLAYQYDAQQQAFYIRESLLVAGLHGASHISQDPIPAASCDSNGLMIADDKCKLDAMVGTRLGVLGFQGAGFPDDGGWLQGDIILAAGSEFMSIERVGNVVRFVVDVPTPFTCAAEECFQVYWIQDETDTGALRPPSCAGKLPGVNTYGELKVYLFPESTIINPNATYTTLSNKGNYPSFIFKRYDDGLGLNEAELDVVLSRNTAGTTKVGWAFTPGATGTAECVWYLGLDTGGNRISYKLGQSTDPVILGNILYKNTSITKQSAVITGYESDVLSSNRYKAKWWNFATRTMSSTEFTVTNIQVWDSTENTKVLDSAMDAILTTGQLIDVWTTKCGATDCYYCVETPILNVNSLWMTIGAAEFGDTLEKRSETSGAVTDVDDTLLVDPSEWGLTNSLDPLYLYIDVNNQIPASGSASYNIDIVDTVGGALIPDRRYLEVNDDLFDTSGNIQRPVMLWNKTSTRNALFEIHLARPPAPTGTYSFPPIDVLMRAPISQTGSLYGLVSAAATITGGRFVGSTAVTILGVTWDQIPKRGAMKFLNANGSDVYGQVIEYSDKLMDGSGNVRVITTTAIGSIPTNATVEILHEEYTTPALRLRFTNSEHDVELQPIVGTLDMGITASFDVPGGAISDDFIKDFSAYTAGSNYWQDGDAETTATGITTSDAGFYVLTGGILASQEYYNVLRVMVNEEKVWVWWNNLLLAASTNQPYYIIDDVIKYGKFGLRLWPGARIRRAILRTKLLRFSELSLGQLEIS